MTNKEWFKDAKFGMMVHWGLYSLLAGEYKGQRMERVAEWAQHHFQIPSEEYHRLANAFNPIYFDAEEWVKIVKNAGMKYMVVTSKHHDGFAMYKSVNDSYNVCDTTPFKRDVIAELAEACRKNDIKLGLYYSQELDWNEPNGGGYHLEWDENGSAANEWDYPDPDKKIKNYALCFEKKIKPQVKEILTKYGDLCLIWFDTPHVITPEQSRELYDMVKKYQPNCLVNSRIGNGMGDYTSTDDNEIPEDDKGEMLYEAPVTLNDTWGYKAYDQNWKSAERITELKKHLNDRGINLLLNVGPDGLGRIPAPSVDILKKVGELSK